MRQDTPTCRVTERLGDAQERSKAAGQSVCIVTTENGVVLGRIRGEALEGDAGMSVESVMEAGPTTIRPDTPLNEYTEHMRAMRVGSILVTTSTGRLLGILHRQDAEKKLGSSTTT
ncbi:MAG: CBS domain-containing protein [Chloroflexi bacterium]|nr:CBS domain-containing protein [Chloroflexota bacterium]